jgi:hypothetical protein
MLYTENTMEIFHDKYSLKDKLNNKSEKKKIAMPTMTHIPY